MGSNEKRQVASAVPAKRKGRSRVLLVDDHPIVRQGLAELIHEEADLEVCGEAADGASALKLLPGLKPDLVVVDISLKGMSGIELIKEIRARDESVKILVASMHDESIYADRALRAGATGYINKQEATSMVIDAIHQVLAGNVYLSKPIADAALRRMVGPSAPGARSPLEVLSDRELEIFELIGSGRTTAEIAARLSLSVKTIETHRRNIKSKLNIKNATQLITTAVRMTQESARSS